VDALRRFGLHFGIAFQVNDDVLDLVQTAERLGKPAGQDIAEGVYTLPTLRALARSPELRELLGQRHRPSADEVERARKLVVGSGTLEECSAVADEHVALAVEAIRSTGAPAAAVEALVDFARNMLNAVGIADPREGASLFYRPAERATR
jgi:geranylgeranyl pyrophosphate synthase